MTPATRRQAADLAVLHVYDRVRELAGHDYAGSRRRMELSRRERAVADAGAVLAHAVAYACTDGDEPAALVAQAERELGGPLTPRELGEAWRRTIEPRRQRHLRESRAASWADGEQHLTPAARRTIVAYRTAWHRLEARVVVLAGVPDNVGARLLALATASRNPALVELREAAGMIAPARPPREPLHGDDLPRPADEPGVPMAGDRW